ncbi:diguanylate cyclase [Bacillus coahuilensis m2-6]|uniref:dipeptidase n=1 Tax=Bacillus coahuilensis TaxID=408580 RepID=UPI0007504F03|nr:dipeptidase [Bacillus coahuilensis]KUP08326.1 diguanylate cyclase [Bacillus coahuilensis m2-6]
MIFDAHCDVLYKMYLNPRLQFYQDSSLHITYEQLVSTGGKIQLFAIYLPSHLKPGERFSAALRMVDDFYEKLSNLMKSLKLIISKHDVTSLREGEIGAILTLEGCEAIEEDIMKLSTLLRLGVRSVGLTWNFANAVADGAMEPRGAGLTTFGYEVVEMLNEWNAWIDVSHLSEKAFWDVMKVARFPIASHSNSYTLCPHPRNLKDNQIDCLKEKGGKIGITFVPHFLKENGPAVIDDVLSHVDYMLQRTGEHVVGFGSDFDGIEETVVGLHTYRNYQQLIDRLYKEYRPQVVKNILFLNFASAIHF